MKPKGDIVYGKLKYLGPALDKELNMNSVSLLIEYAADAVPEDIILFTTRPVFLPIILSGITSPFDTTLPSSNSVNILLALLY
jgi:hypothetical protein